MKNVMLEVIGIKLRAGSATLVVPNSRSRANTAIKVAPPIQKRLNLMPITLGVILNLAIYSGVLFAGTGQDLFVAAIQGQPQRVNILLSSGVDVNSQVVSGRTALMAAAYSGNYRVMQILIAYGAKVNLHDNQGSTALMDAIMFGDPRLVNLLISAGADVNAADKMGVRVLVKAKKTGHTQLLKILEEAGAKEKEEVKVEEKPAENKAGENTGKEKLE